MAWDHLFDTVGAGINNEGASSNTVHRIARATIMTRLSFKTLSAGLIALASMLAAPLAADASTLTYSATGGIITGTLGGTAFTDATWSITGTANPTNVVSGSSSAGPRSIPFNFLAMTPVLTITTGSSTLQATILTEDGSIGQQVGVFSLDLSFIRSGFGLDFFGYLNGDGSPSTEVFGVGAGPQLYTDLQSTFSGFGAQNVITGFNTDAGLCDVTDSENQGATFTVSSASPSAVPEIDPNSLGSVLALVMGSLGLLERRRLKAA